MITSNDFDDHGNSLGYTWYKPCSQRINGKRASAAVLTRSGLNAQKKLTYKVQLQRSKIEIDINMHMLMLDCMSADNECQLL